jgi:thiol-disulfide isomerase/thioredoxin
LIDNTVYKFPSDKPVLIHFWATWCPTCKLEAANIEFISKHFEVVTIAVDSGTSAKLRAYIKEKNYTYRVVNDSLKHLSKEFNIAGFPTTFIYDKNKKLIFSEVGYTSIIGLYLRMWWTYITR